jgi:hypothetical protein
LTAPIATLPFAGTSPRPFYRAAWRIACVHGTPARSFWLFFPFTSLSFFLFLFHQRKPQQLPVWPPSRQDAHVRAAQHVASPFFFLAAALRLPLFDISHRTAPGGILSTTFARAAFQTASQDQSGSRTL